MNNDNNNSSTEDQDTDIDTMLTSFDGIDKTLNDDSTTENQEPNSKHPKQDLAKSEQTIAELENIVFNSNNPTAPAPNRMPKNEDLEVTEQEPEIQLEIPMMPSVKMKPIPEHSNNPFLPSHILKQLKQDNRSLVEEIAQSGEALNASTAILRTHTRTEPSNFNDKKSPDEDINPAEAKAKHYKIIDDLVDEYLPLIAADLRRKLKLLLD